ncbi:taste receptor type 2 member 40-like [Pelobates fuscus]|uniref:taste receptor type 2 member 40-like n=1 Tax=Pelobates fuscus TaxID=191477 RepID=UPI002FE47454
MGLENIVIPSFVDIFLIILIAETFLGALTNVFIILVNVQAWMKGQTLNSSDHIVVALAFSNMGFSCVNAATTIFIVFFKEILFTNNSIFSIIYYIMSYTIFSSSWLNAWLCLFFFLKIISFKDGCLSWLKMNISSVVPWLILISQIISFVSCLPLIWTITEVYADNTTTVLATNQTTKLTGYQINTLYNLYSLVINCIVPFLVVMVTTGRIITSLCSHTRHMKDNMGESGGPSLKAHQTAARTMTSLLILYLIFYVVEVALGYLPMISPLYWVCFIAMASFSTVESILLIMGNSKLKQACEGILKHCRKTG